MGLCKYCRQKAAWFADVHPACMQKAAVGIESIKACIAETVTTGMQYREVQDKIAKVATEATLSQDQARAAIISGWSQGAEQRSKAQPINPEESLAIDKIIQDAGFKPEDTLWTAGGWSMTFSFLIWAVLHDKIEELRRTQPYQWPVNFNLEAGELPVWGLPNMLLKQQRTTTSYVGGYSGASIRVASGLYYHLGGLNGHRVETNSLEEVDYGHFLMTSRAIYFGGMERGINFRLPYRQIIRFQPYSDAIGICKSASREQIFVPIGAHTPAGIALSSRTDRSRVRLVLSDRPQTLIAFPDCGWFLFNILQALAAKDSTSKVRGV